MPVQKVTQASVQGLATNANSAVLPLGTCAVADNVVSRRPGMLAPMPRDVTLVGPLLPEEFVISKMMYDELQQRVVLVQSSADDAAIWNEDPVGEDMTGRVVTYFVKQDESMASSVYTEVPTGIFPSSFPATRTREIGFIPGLTQTAYSHFRQLTTEKWGVLANYDRLAGLAPPLSFAARAIVDDAVNWLLPNRSVAYRAVFTLESQDETRQYIVTGPVSSAVAVKNVDDETTAYTIINFRLPTQEPIQPSGDLELFLSIYRSSQEEVETPLDLADDFRRVHKQRLVREDFDQGVGVLPGYTFQDKVSALAWNSGEPLYTNSAQQGASNNSFAPPVARDVCVFKDTTFYANRASLPAVSVTVPGRLGMLLSESDRTTGVGTRTFATASVTNGSNIVTFADPAELVGVVAGQTLALQLSGGLDVKFVLAVTSSTTVTTAFPAYTVTESALEGQFNDMATVEAHYADGSVVFFKGPVLDFDNAGGLLYNGTTSLTVTNIPGFRMFAPALDPTRVVEGVTLTFIETWQGIKKMNYFKLTLTNRDNYYPAPQPVGGEFFLKSLGDTRPNRLFFSKTGEPEAVPLGKYLDVGAGTILKMWANQSALFVLCTDGLWRVSGDGTDFAVYQIDPTVLLLHPDLVTALNNKIYAWVDDGIALITEDGSQTISTDAIGPAAKQFHTVIRGWGAPYVWGPAMTGDHFFNEIWINVYRAASSAGEEDFRTSFVYNDDTKNFTTQTLSRYSSLTYSSAASRTVFTAPTTDGSDNTNLVTQTDFTLAVEDQYYRPVTIWFNPVQTEDKGNLKQWLDVNLFFARSSNRSPDGELSRIQFRFDPRGHETDPTALPVNTRAFADNDESIDIHNWVPRRAALADQIQYGFRTYVQGQDDYGPYFELQGFTTRYRVSSKTLKR